MNKFDNIKEIINELLKIYDSEYKRLKPNVDYIIKNNIKDIKYIEQILEQLLNIPYEPCNKLFIRLCKYVENFNKEMSDEYMDLFNKLYNEENVKTKKKKM